ncbi:MAG: lactate utilization protein [Pseudomonadota bacterium]
MTTTQMADRFKEKASLVSAHIHDMGTLEDVFQKTLDLCAAKAPLQSMMPSSPGQGGSTPVDGEGRVIAAPNLSDAEFTRFQFLCREREITLIRDGLRRYPGGIDLGLTHVNFGIAETGTLVLNSNSEETRLSTMLCELHVAVLPASAIRPTALDMAEELKALTAIPGSFTAFITGASRTADIERVLALGVHGPLELHIMLLTE